MAANDSIDVATNPMTDATGFVELSPADLRRMSVAARLDYEAQRAAAHAHAAASQDFPILPTSADDLRPCVAAEPDDNLSPGQRLAVAALVAGATYTAAAREAGVSRRTLWQWRRQPAFQAALDRLSREAMLAVVMRVRNLMLRATRVMGDAMTDPARGATHAFKVLNSRKLWDEAVAIGAEDDGSDDAAVTPGIGS
jgi:transposase-like protein